MTYIEASATKLLEENGVVTGVQYKEKESDELKVRHLVFVNFTKMYA